MRSAATSPVRAALVLAAGNGDRFQNVTRTSKLLEPILGEPLIARTIRTAARAGVTAFEIVLGYQADSVRAVVLAHAPAGVSLHFTVNPEWHLENGVSVLAARDRFRDGHFALIMGDHLFEPDVLAGMLSASLAPDESALAVDSRPARPDVALEATKVRLEGDRITAIGKNLGMYDALDTGLFVCAPTLFQALGIARAAGDTTLSGGISRLAAQGLMRARNIGDAQWRDIDTVSDLASAEALLASPEHA